MQLLIAMLRSCHGYAHVKRLRCWLYLAPCPTVLPVLLVLYRRLPEASLREYDYYQDTHRLRISVSNMKNMNTKEELEEIKRRVIEHLSQLPPVRGWVEILRG